MGEYHRQPQPITLDQLLQAVEQNALASLGLPEAAQSEFDTWGPSVPLSDLPEGVYDVRESQDHDFEDWTTGDLVRGTFTLNVVNQWSTNTRTAAPQAWARAESSTDQGQWYSWNDWAQVRGSYFNIGAYEPLEAEQFAVLSQLGRLQVVGDIEYLASDEYGVGYGALRAIHAVQQPHDGHSRSILYGRPNVVQGQIKEFRLGQNLHSPGIDPYSEDQSWVEVDVPNPDTGEEQAVRVMWLHSRHRYASSSYETGYDEQPVVQPQVGDRVQIICRAVPESYNAFSDRPPLLTSPSGEMHLLRPSDRQKDRLIELESSLPQPLERQGNLDKNMKAFRQRLGAFIAEQLDEYGNLKAAMPPSYNRRLNALAVDYNRIPEQRGQPNEQYVGHLLDQTTAQVINKAYGINIFTYNIRELAALSQEIALGEQRPVAGVGEGYGEALFNVLRAYYRDNADLTARLTIGSLYDTALLSSSRHTHAYIHDKSLLLASLRHLPNVGDRHGLARNVMDFAQNVFAHDAPPHPMREELRLPAMHAVYDALKRCALWRSSGQRGTIEDIIGVTDIDNFLAIKASINPLMKNVHSYWTTSTNTNPDFRKRHSYFKHIIEVFKRLNALSTAEPTPFE